MFPTRRRILRSVLIVPMVIAAGLATGEAGAAPAKPTPAPTAPTAADKATLAAERAVGTLTAKAAAGDALGTYYDAPTRQYVVAVPSTGPGSTLTAANVAVPGLSVRVEKRATTGRAITALRTELRARTWHPTAKRHAYGFYVEPKRGVTVVRTDAPASVLSPLLDRHPGRIVVEPTKAQRTNRFNDPPAHWGGATLTSGSTCTAGFVVKNGAGIRSMVTAGHCFAVGAVVRTGGGTWQVGTVTNRAPFAAWDLELIGGGSYGKSVYRGNEIASGALQLSAGDPIVGFKGYCFNGQTTGGESCNHTADSLDAEFCDGAGCTTSLIAFSGGSAPKPGDSGAPFYLPTSGGVHARGIVIAVAGSTGFAERWNTVASRFGVTIVN